MASKTSRGTTAGKRNIAARVAAAPCGCERIWAPGATLDWSALPAHDATEAGTCTCETLTDPATDSALCYVFNPSITLDWSAVDPTEAATVAGKVR